MSDIVLQWPIMLLLGLLALPLGFLLARARRLRKRMVEALGEPYRTHRLLRDHLRVAALLLMVVALARPGYAPEREGTTRSTRDVVFALDVSRSMLAEDVAPSRLEVAKQAIRDALEVLGDHRVALVAYAGSATILCPLTYDHDFVRYMVDQAHPRSVAFGGTFLQSAVELAVDQVFMEDRKGGHDLVVLTDGADHGSNMDLVIEQLAAMEVDTLFVGLGDPETAVPIPIEGRDGEVTFLEVNGETIYTRLKDAELAAMAARTERIDYFAAGTRPFHLGQVYRAYAADNPAPTVEIQSGVMVYREAAFFFIVPALLLLFFSERWGARGLRLGLIVGLSLWALPEHAQAAGSSFHEQFRAATRLFESGDFLAAEQKFRGLYASAPVDRTSRETLAVLQFNLGLSLTQRAEAVAADSPGEALLLARAARDAFLLARRHDPRMDRAGVRLVSMGRVIETHIAASAAEEKEPGENPNLLADSPPDPSVGEDEADPDLGDGEELSDAGESQSSSQMSSADFAASVEMQALPVPNYSAEDILREEQVSRQFREQTRARSNAAQVERDY